MTAEFRIGDVVRLKSGGPDMTITAMEAEEGADETRIFVARHDGEVLARVELPEVVLEHAGGGGSGGEASRHLGVHVGDRFPLQRYAEYGLP